MNKLLQTEGITTRSGVVTRDTLIAALQAGTKTRADVLRVVVEHPDVSMREYNPTFVAMQYFGYLRRDPEPTGYQAWLNYLIAHPADFRSMVNSFMNSTEYKLRFGQP